MLRRVICEFEFIKVNHWYMQKYVESTLFVVVDE